MSIRFPNLGLEFDYVAKSIRIFGFEITLYGMLIAVGMLLGIAFVILEAKRHNQNQDLYLDMIIISLITGVIGARLFYVGFYWNLYKGDWHEIMNIRAGGMSIYGGLLGGVIGGALFCKLKKLSFWQMADTASMGILIGQIIGRWGNFFNRESFGEYTSNALAMQLPLSAVRSGEVTSLMRENLEVVNGISYIQVHPVFLYESVWCLILFLLLLVWSRKKLFEGEVFMRYLAGYGLGRFCFEWLRTDKILFPGTTLAVSQIISAVLFIYFGITVIIRRIMAKKRAAVRKRRREREYEAEERAQAGKDEGGMEERTEDEEASGNTEEDALSKNLPEEYEAESREAQAERYAKAEYASKAGSDPESEYWWRKIPGPGAALDEKTASSMEETSPSPENQEASKQAEWPDSKPDGSAEEPETEPKT